MQAVARLAAKVEKSESSYPATHVQASYLSPMILRGSREKALAAAVEALKTVEYDTIAVRGVSGLLMGPTLAFLTGKELLVLRKSKNEERSTSYRDAEGHIAIKRYIIVDDLISSGSTVVRIIRHIKKEVSPNAELAGILLYGENPPDGDINFMPVESYRVRNLIKNADNPEFCLVR